MKVLNMGDFSATPKGAVKQITRSCEDHGEYTVEALYLGGKLRNENPTCPKCFAVEVEQESKQDALRIAAERVERMLERSGIEKRMKSCRISSYRPPNKKSEGHRDTCIDFINNWPEALKTGRNLIMLGKPGNGKTHLACAIATAVISKYGQQAIYTRSDDMASYIRTSYGAGSDYTEADAIKRFGEVPLLVIDELGSNIAKDHERSLQSRIIDRRYLQMLPTIAISNLTLSDLASATDERMIDRLKENSTGMVFDWDSFRGRT